MSEEKTNPALIFVFGLAVGIFATYLYARYKGGLGLKTTQIQYVRIPTESSQAVTPVMTTPNGKMLIKHPTSGEWIEV